MPNLFKQWAVINQDSSNNLQEFEPFDDTECSVIQCLYIRFCRSGGNSSIQRLIANGLKIDIQSLQQQRLVDPTRIRRIKRVAQRKRSFKSLKYQSTLDFSIFQLYNQRKQNNFLSNKYLEGRQMSMPSLNDVLKGLINQMSMSSLFQLPLDEMSASDIANIKNIHSEVLTKFFLSFGFDSLDQKIDFDQLSNPYSKITKLILSIYSLETQIYKDIEKSEKESNLLNVNNLGPFALCLSEIIQNAQYFKDPHEDRKEFISCRACFLDEQQISNIQQSLNEYIQFSTFVSTSQSYDFAINYGIENKEDNQNISLKPVLFQFEQNSNGNGFFDLNSQEFSLYQQDQAILIGSEQVFKIKKIENIKDQPISYLKIIVEAI